MSEPTKGTEKSKTSLTFIHRTADDYGFSMAEFRLFCHICRRVECYAALDTISEICRMDRKTVQRCIKSLIALQVISSEKRIGRTSILRIRPYSEWLPNPKDTLGVKRVGGEPKRHPNHLTQKTPCEVTPSEVTPNKGGNAPWLFPRELEGAIRDQKIEILKLDGDNVLSQDSPSKIRLLIGKLNEYEIQKHGAPLTSLPETPNSQDMHRFMGRLSSGVATGRNGGTYNASNSHKGFDHEAWEIKRAERMGREMAASQPVKQSPSEPPLSPEEVQKLIKECRAKFESELAAPNHQP